MTSVALEEWRGPSSRALDEIEILRGQIGEEIVGGAAMVQQVDYAYVALVLAHFQRYCRAVHTEAVDALIARMPNAGLAKAMVGLLVEQRFLDRGNPTPANLGQDFARFGFRLWSALEDDDRRNRRRQEKLGQLCQWRNGITHGDVPRKRAAGQLVPPDLDLDICRDWRRTLGALAGSIDRVVAAQCQELVGEIPW